MGYHARFIACGYSQVAGVDFLENYLLVMNEITVWVLLLLMVYFSLSAKVAHVEFVFLYRELEEETYMECPLGMKDIGKDYCIIFQKCICVLVQAARQSNKNANRFWKG